MQAGFDTTGSYQQIVRHATALAGSVSVAIDLFDSQTHLLHRVATSHAIGAHAPSPPGEAPAVDPDHLLYAPEPTDFASAVLRAGTHEAPIAQAARGGPPAAVETCRALGITHAVGCRLESRGQVWGLMLFLMDHPTTVEERSIIQGFASQAARYADPTWDPESGRYRSRQRVQSVLDIADAALR